MKLKERGGVIEREGESEGMLSSNTRERERILCELLKEKRMKRKGFFSSFIIYLFIYFLIYSQASTSFHIATSPSTIY